MMRRALVLLTASLLALSLASSCRILSREVACLRNADCPRDAGLDFCDVPEDSDGGPGVCVEENPRPSADDEDDAADAGPADGGA